MLFGLGPSLGDIRRADIQEFFLGRPSKKTEDLLAAHRMELNAGTMHTPKRGFFKNLMILGKPFYWDRFYGSAADKRSALLDGALLTSAISLTTYNVVAIATGFNDWNGDMFDLIQSINAPDSPGTATIMGQYAEHMGELGILIGKALGVQFASYKIGEVAKLRWREWMSDDYESLWLDVKSFYHMQHIDKKIDNPDQRIHEDPMNVPSYAFDLTKGLIDAGLSIGIFSYILWQNSQSQVILGTEIPKFMFFFCIAFAAAGTLGMHKISKPIEKLNLKLQNFEGDYRGDLREVHTKAEAIALNNAEGVQKTILRSAFDKVKKSSNSLINIGAGLSVVRMLYNRVASVVPLAVMFPLMADKVISLGTYSRVANAFGEVQSGLSFYVNNAVTIRTANSYMERLSDMRATLKEIQQKNLQVDEILRAETSSELHADKPHNDM